MEIVRYRPGEAVRWLQTGAEHIRKQATTRGRSVVAQSGTDQKPLVQNVRTAASALIDLGRSAYADILHRQAQAQEYVLMAERLEVVSGPNLRVIRYAAIQAVALHSDRIALTLEKGHLTIKPFAFIVSGRIKVPVGWTRNAIEVPFELLAEELSARANVELEEL